jgi:hypothetical protein
MPRVIGHYLSHADERQRIVDAGHRFVTEELTLSHAVTAVLGLVGPAIDRHREATRGSSAQ